MDKTASEKRQEQIYSRIAFCLFFVYAIIGFFLFDDYGCGPDEGMERQTALVNLKYVVNKFDLPVGEKNQSWLEYLPELHEYRDRYYGSALHFPLVLIECIYHFTLEPSRFYGMRHFYTFLNYFLGMICFYKLLSKRFHSGKFGLIGILMMILTPRFFAESFYNNKDVIFTAWYLICSFFTDLWFRDRNLKTSFLLAFVIALTCNTRFNGIIFIPVILLLFIFETIRNKRIVFYEVRYLLVTLILTGFFFYLITPNLWENPIQTLFEMLQFNMRHPNHGSDGNLFRGVLVDAARTWTFIPMWMLLTIPTVYVFLSSLGTMRYLGNTIRFCCKKDLFRISITDMMMFICGYAAVVFIISTHVTIYNGWRHCYFSYPCIVYFAVYMIQYIGDRGYKISKYAISAVLCASFLYNGFWITKNHPFEYVYFAPIFRNETEKYSGDYWSMSTRAMFEYITETDPHRMLLINHSHTQAGSINRGLLPEDKRIYLELTYEDSNDVDYYIVTRDDIPTVNIDLRKRYKKVFSIKIDEDEIAAVFKKESKK